MLTSALTALVENSYIDYDSGSDYHPDIDYDSDSDYHPDIDYRLEVGQFA
jgi:hypothetical protein